MNGRAAAKPRGLHGSRRVWAVGVLAATSRIVRQAARGEWDGVSCTVQQRRRLLERLAGGIPELRDAAGGEATSGRSNCTELSCIEALQQAVAESDALIAMLNKVGTANARGALHV